MVNPVDGDYMTDQSRRTDSPTGLDTNASHEIDAQESTTQPLDALAEVLRLIGRYSFDLPNQSQMEFQELCDRWVQHLLLGRAPDGREETTASSGPVRRRWQELREFLGERRQREAAFVAEYIGLCGGGLAELASELHRQQKNEEAARLELQSELDALLGDLGEFLEDDAAGVVDKITTVKALAARQGRQAAYASHQVMESLAQLRDQVMESSGAGDLDPLTKVFAPVAFKEHLEYVASIARDTGESVVLGIVDINRLDEVNRQFGTTAGDQLLCSLADCIVRCFPRKHDFIARLGGSTFGLILRDLDRDSARRLMERFTEAGSGISISVRDVSITCNFAVGYTLVAENERIMNCYERAAGAMRRAKHQGNGDACYAAK